MKKFLKWFLILTVLLVVAGVVAVTLLLDTEALRKEVAERFEARTGHRLVIAEPIEWSFFPWLGLKLEGVEVGNAPGFGEAPLARIQRLAVKVALEPLLHKRIVVDEVQLLGVDLNLVRNRAGKGNWEGLAAQGSKAEETAGAAGGAKPKAGADYRLELKGLVVEDLDLDYRDLASGQAYALEDLQVEVGELIPGQPVPVSLALKLAAKAPAVESKLRLSAELTTAQDFRRIDLSALSVVVDAQGEGLPEGGVHLQAAGNLALDLAHDRLALSDFSLAGPEVDVTGAISIAHLKERPDIEGHLALQKTDLRKLLQRLGISVETADAKALSRLSARLTFKPGEEALRIDPLSITLDDTKVEGYLALPSFEGPVVRARLKADAIDLDRYLPPPGEGGEASAPPARGQAKAAPKAIDFAPLRRLDAQVVVTLDELKIHGLKVQGVQLTLKAEKGLLRLDPLAARLYGGKLDGDARLDVRRDQPALGASAHLAGVQIGPLLADATGKEVLTGTGALRLALSSRGLADAELRRNLEGEFAIDFRDGAYKGFNLAQAIRKAWAAVKGQTVADDQPKETDFAQLKGSGKIHRGLLTNEDLLLSSPVLRVKGKGRVDLVEERIDYRLTAKVVGTLVGQGGESMEELKGVPIPVHIGGTFQEPKPSIDLKALAKALAQSRLKEKKEALMEKATKKLEKKLGGDLLKGLLGN